MIRAILAVIFKPKSLRDWGTTVLVFLALGLLIFSVVVVPARKPSKEVADITSVAFFVDTATAVVLPSDASITCEMAPRLIYSMIINGGKKNFHGRIVLDRRKVLLDRKMLLQPGPAWGYIPLSVQAYAVGKHSATLTIGGITKKLRFIVVHMKSCPL